MATRTPEQIVLAGIVPTYHACSDLGDEFENSGQCVIQLKNVNAAARTVTIDTFTPCNYGMDTEHDVAVEIPLNVGDKVIGPFPKSRFNDADGKIQLTYDHHEDLSIAIVDLP